MELIDVLRELRVASRKMRVVRNPPQFRAAALDTALDYAATVLSMPEPTEKHVTSALQMLLSACNGRGLWSTGNTRDVRQAYDRAITQAALGLSDVARAA